MRLNILPSHFGKNHQLPLDCPQDFFLIRARALPEAMLWPYQLPAPPFRSSFCFCCLSDGQGHAFVQSEPLELRGLLSQASPCSYCLLVCPVRALVAGKPIELPPPGLPVQESFLFLLPKGRPILLGSSTGTLRTWAYTGPTICSLISWANFSKCQMVRAKCSNRRLHLVE